MIELHFKEPFCVQLEGWPYHPTIVARFDRYADMINQLCGPSLLSAEAAAEARERLLSMVRGYASALRAAKTTT